MQRPRSVSLFCLSVASLLVFSVGAIAQDALPEVELETSEGTIVIELNAEKAPKTVANFLEYVQSGHYEGTVFHRVIKDFMIQGGGLEEDLSEKATRPPVVNEGGNGLINKEYTVAMARTPAPNSATSQFFINHRDNDGLNHGGPYGGYAVFGKVVSGMDVVDAIAAIPTKVVGMHQNMPVEPVIITKAVAVN